MKHCTGPCEQGKATCPCPDACEQGQDHLSGLELLGGLALALAAIVVLGLLVGLTA